MGSTVRTNDTLQLTASQGFPAELDLGRHRKTPLSAAQFGGRIFSFWGKEGVRNFQQPPVKNCLVENRGGKHLYWGLITVLTVNHDYAAQMTSGQYQLYMLYTYEKMKLAARMLGLDAQLDYFL